MNIGELAKAFAVRASTLRFYERIGILAPTGRVSGRRQYDTAAAQRLSFILSARESGFALKEIKGFISAASQGVSPRHLWRSAAATKRVRVEQEIQRLRTVQESLKRKAACRCKTLRDCERMLAQGLRPAAVRQKITTRTS